MSKRERLKSLLKADIVTGEYKSGDRLPSENEIVAKYKVSRNTVRETLSALVEDGLLYRINGKGTFLSDRKVVRGKIALIVPYLSQGADSHSRLMARIDIIHGLVDKLESCAYDAGCDTLLHISNGDFEKEQSVLKRLASSDIQAVLVIHMVDLRNLEYLSAIRENGTPVIAIDEWLPTSGFSVGCDNFQGAKAATDNLLDNGFKHICYITHDSYFAPLNSRIEGHLAALKDRGYSPDIIYINISEDRSETDWEKAAYESVKKAAAGRSSLAVFADMPILARGAWKAMLETDITHESLALASFDDPFLVLPKKVYQVMVIQPLSQMAKTAIQLATNEIMPDSQQLIIPPTINVSNR
ncbi:MAG: GntR family transcriptional regulator [Armatimonadota bacterium]